MKLIYFLAELYNNRRISNKIIRNSIILIDDINITSSSIV